MLPKPQNSQNCDDCVKDGIIVICTKSHGNPKLVEKLWGRTATSPVVFIQNGLGVEESFLLMQFPQVFRCVLFATSQVISHDILYFKPVTAPHWYGKGEANTLQFVVRHLNSKNFSFRAEENI